MYRLPRPHLQSGHSYGSFAVETWLVKCIKTNVQIGSPLTRQGTCHIRKLYPLLGK